MTSAPRVGALGISHSPLKGVVAPADPEAQSAHDQALASARQWIAALDPELVVVFGPDHYRGFFNDLMPAFCIGIETEGIGDWQTSRGPLNVPSDIALACTRHLQEAGFDPAFSYRMTADHGITQPLDWLGIGLQGRRVLPIFMNCLAKPLPSFRRVRELGAAVGHFVGELGCRALLIGSGGLSHDPPIPTMTSATLAVRERIVARRVMTEADLQEAVTRVSQEARNMAAGTSSRLPPDEAWDRAFLSILQSGRLELADALDDAIERVAGQGGHEVRTWIAAFSARAAVGTYRADLLYYRVVREWLTGMAILKAA